MKRSLIAVICLLAMLLPACGTAVEGGADGDAVTFTDALERTVSVKKNPERVAALLGSFADVWTLAGGDQIQTVRLNE